MSQTVQKFQIDAELDIIEANKQTRLTKFGKSENSVIIVDFFMVPITPENPKSAAYSLKRIRQSRW